MAMCSYARGTLALAWLGVLVAPVQATDYPYTVVVDPGEAYSLGRGDRITIVGPGAGRAIEVKKRASFDAYDVDIVNRSSGNRTRHAYGLLTYGEASAFIGDSRIVGSGARSIGVHAQDISRVTLQNVDLRMSAADSIGISSRSGSRVTANRVGLRMDGDNAIGVLARGANSRVVGSGLSIVHAGQRKGAAGALELADGISLSDGASIMLTSSSVLTEQPGVNAVSIQGATSAFNAGDTRIVAAGSGSTAIALAGGVATIDSGEVRGTGHAIRAVQGHTGDVAVRVTGGATITGRIENAGQLLSLLANHSKLQGDIVSTGSGPLRVRLDKSSWQGRGERLAELIIADGSWKATGDSSVQYLALQGRAQVAFDGSAPASTLRVGTFAHPGGEGGVTLRTRLDGGGAIGRQFTDRLLVAGDAIGTTRVHIVNVAGAGADTSALTGEPRAGDGISIVQVGGNADATSFYLDGGYVAVGPWQYGLVAYAPGVSEAGQRLLEGDGNDHWDYRLQSRSTDAAGHAVSGASPATRARLVPQVPAYLVMANALFGYGQASMDAWRSVEPAAPRDPAWRVHSFGGACRLPQQSALPALRHGLRAIGPWPADGRRPSRLVVGCHDDAGGAGTFDGRHAHRTA